MRPRLAWVVVAAVVLAREHRQLPRRRSQLLDLGKHLLLAPWSWPRCSRCGAEMITETAAEISRRDPGPLLCPGCGPPMKRWEG